MAKINVCARCHGKIKEAGGKLSCMACGSTGPFMFLDEVAAAKLESPVQPRPRFYRRPIFVAAIASIVVLLFVARVLL